MNVYDKAHELAKEIKESEEYAKYKFAKEKVEKDIELSKKIKEFETMKYNTQIFSVQNEKKDESKMKELQEKYAELMQNEVARSYFELELRFNVMLADVNKIIAESIQDVLK